MASPVADLALIKEHPRNTLNCDIGGRVSDDQCGLDASHQPDIPLHPGKPTDGAKLSNVTTSSLRLVNADQCLPDIEDTLNNQILDIRNVQ